GGPDGNPSIGGRQARGKCLVTGPVIARFPHALEHLVTHPGRRFRAGAIDNHDCVIELEGHADPRGQVLSGQPVPRDVGRTRSGLRLEQHYSLPVCSPTRSSLLTGRFNSRFGCTNPVNARVLPFDTVTLASALKAVGYETALVGKWHLGSKPEWGPQKYGFD